MIMNFDKLELGSPVVAGNLAAYPLFAAGANNPLDYALLDDALDSGAVQITELDASGSVPELKLVNNGRKPVPLLDGDQLIGAKQNRVINITILIDAETAVVIPVSCVEQGRWRHDSDRFRSARRTMHASGRMAKMAQVSESLRHSGERRSDQSAVWDEIAAFSACHGVGSPTGAVEDVYVALDKRIHEIIARMQLPAGALGAVFCVDGRPTGLELFDKAGTLQRVAPKLVASYAYDAASSEKPRHGDTSSEAVEAFLYRVMTAPGERFNALGLGEDVRLESLHVIGGALKVHDHLVHLSAFDRHAPTARRRRTARQDFVY